MNLLTKTNTYYFVYTTLVFLIGGIILYFIIRYVIREQISGVLQSELTQIIEDLENSGETPKSLQTVEFELHRVAEVKMTTKIKDTLIVETENPEEVTPYLQITTYKIIQGQPFKVVLRESLIENQGIAWGVFLSTGIMLAAILMGLLMINFYLPKKIWGPFYQNLKLLKDFDVTNSAPINVVNSDIKEFRELNETIVKMTGKIREDYVSLKEFTENASHELQTPVAIIKSNVDLLLQSIKLTGEELENLNRINNAANRISKTNQALLLLSKIENNQFQNLEQVDLKEYLTQIIDDFEEYIEARKVKIDFKTESDQKLLVNPALARILLNNVISNALKHNIEGGHISIDLKPGILTVANSGPKLTHDPNKLFERFVKENQAAESSGLGLSIVKSIAELYGFDLTYQFKNNRHSLEFRFK